MIAASLTVTGGPPGSPADDPAGGTRLV
ncbi:MAG: hypothetical protein JWQ88_3178, partial [Rhodoferax sp.]|nr:hypothetical protein [Rhodoferax sp.]